MPLWFTCTTCDGTDSQHCPECKGLGPRMHKVDRCPHEWIGDGIAGLFEMVDFAEAGNFPVAGGVLDQTQSFLDALRFVRSEKRLFPDVD